MSLLQCNDGCTKLLCRYIAEQKVTVAEGVLQANTRSVCVISTTVDTILTDAEPSRTIAWSISSELLDFCYYFFLIFSFLCRALD